MRHVFVETSWIVAYASPAHHRVQQAVDLIARARRRDIVLHVPAFCLTEARRPIRAKQPRYEADKIRHFVRWAASKSVISATESQATLSVLDRFEASVMYELDTVGNTLSGLAHETNVEIFPLNERMLERACNLAVSEFYLKAFDQAVLAAVLVRAEELAAEDDAEFVFCTTDTDLHPHDRAGNRRAELADLYEGCRIQVQRNFDIGE